MKLNIERSSLLLSKDVYDFYLYNCRRYKNLNIIHIFYREDET